MVGFSKINNLKAPRFRYRNYQASMMLTYFSSLDYHYSLFHFSVQYRKSVELDYSYVRLINIRLFNFNLTVFLNKYENMNLSKYEAYKIAYKKYMIK